MANNNFDDFDDTPPSLDDGMVVDDAPEEEQPRTGLAETLKGNPAFKIFLILIAGGALASAALGIFSSSSSTQQETPSVIGQPGDLTSTPGGQASPAFQQAVVEASKQRAQGAVETGGSALPTPLGGQTQITTLEPTDTTGNNDPLAEFRADAIDPPVAAEAPAAPSAPAATYNAYPTAPPPVTYDTQGMTQAIQQQMQTLIGAWQPGTAKVMTITPPTVADNTPAPTPAPDETQQQSLGKMLVQGGTINYGQMLMEANSDVPGPVMAQIASGPFAGGKAIGTFQTADDFLVIRFSMVSFNGKDYPVDILALNPDTTLGGMATDVDHRYWSRVILPAAADFLTGFANSFAQADQSVAVQDGVVVSSRAGSSVRRGFGEGFAKTGEKLGDILTQRGEQTKVLVKVHAGTPIGLFFVNSVYENQTNQTNGGFGLQPGFGNNGFINQNNFGNFQQGGFGGQQGTGIPITQFGTGQFDQFGNPLGTGGQNFGQQGSFQGFNGGGFGNNGLNGQIPSGVQIIQNGTNRQPVFIGR